ncbi:MAG TPA: efflux RND transporter periplasmic adaptor subunit [Gemmata sp.]|nr:efflux RND transporter periplasmic adaptor subunit [Gemmata sp.]
MKLHRLLALSGLVLAVSLAGCRGKPSPPSQAAPSVLVARPASAPVRDYWEYNGYLAPRDTGEIRARVRGFLTNRFFQEGAEVEGSVSWFGIELAKGDLLFQIDKREYLTAKAKAKSELAKAEADIAKSKADIENWNAQIALAKVELARSEDALNKRVGSKNDVDKAEATLNVNLAQRDAARAQLLASQAAHGSAAEALHSTDIQLGYTDIHAPISGVIGRRLVDVGNLVGQSEQTLLTTIIRVDELYAYFDVPERDLIAYIRDAERLHLPHPPIDRVPMEVRMPGDDRDWRPGEIDYVEGAVNSGTGTVRMRGIVPNPLRPSTDLRLFVAGMYVHVRVPKGPPRPQLVIPEDAIMTGQEGRFVYVIGANDIVEKRLVTVGPPVWKRQAVGPGELEPTWTLVNPNPGPLPQSGPPPSTRRDLYSVVAIVEGLKPEDRVIVEGTQRTRPGSPAKPEDWVINPPAAGTK